MGSFAGSSCIYFQSCEHAGVRAYIDRIIQGLPETSGQIAFDIVETPAPNPCIVVIECNPRAASGIHLFSGTSRLALALTRPVPPVSDQPPLSVATAKPGAHRQLAPGMLIWKRTPADHSAKTALKVYLRHMKRLVCSRDVIFSAHDLLPSLMQPFLLTSYYDICRERKMGLPTMFQYDLTWEPRGEELAGVRRMFEREEMHEGGEVS